jgi:hypothetical protein
MAVDDSRRFSVGLISNDFDANEFQWEEEEQEEEEDRIGDVVSSDSEDSDDDQGGRDAMPTPVDAMPIPVHAMPLPVPTEVLHVMPAQGRLVTHLLEDDTPYDSWDRISEAQQYVPPDPYTAIELMQLRSMNVPFSHVPNYRDVSMTDMAICDTGLQMCRKSFYDHENVIFSKGTIFNTMLEMKLFLKDYAIYHHRPYTITHLDQELRYHVICKNGCMSRLNARKRQSDGKWRITKVVQPHTCLSNKGKKNHQQLTTRYLAHHILELVDNNNDISVSSLQQSIFGFVKYDVKYGKAWHAKQIALAICWGSWEEAYNRVSRILLTVDNYNTPGVMVTKIGHVIICIAKHSCFSQL